MLPVISDREKTRLKSPDGSSDVTIRDYKKLLIVSGINRFLLETKTLPAMDSKFNQFANPQKSSAENSTEKKRTICCTEPVVRPPSANAPKNKKSIISEFLCAY
jgi:hypothetical protein